MLIYIASPYTSQKGNKLLNLEERIVRVRKVEQYIAHVYSIENNRSDMYYSPIVHFHNIAHNNNMPSDAGFWWNINKAILNKSDKMEILMIEGWEESIEVTEEIQYFKWRAKPITYINWK